MFLDLFYLIGYGIKKYWLYSIINFVLLGFGIFLNHGRFYIDRPFLIIILLLIAISEIINVKVNMNRNNIFQWYMNTHNDKKYNKRAVISWKASHFMVLSVLILNFSIFLYANKLDVDTLSILNIILLFEIYIASTLRAFFYDFKVLSESEFLKQVDKEIKKIFNKDNKNEDK